MKRRSPGRDRGHGASGLRRRRARLLTLAALLALALLAWRLTERPERPVAEQRPRATPVEPSPPVLTVSPRRPARRAPSAPSERCTPAVAERCLMGDVWQVDSCGNGEEKVEECAELGCRDDACELPPSDPCVEPPEGRCVADEVRLCLAGRTHVIDCRARGMRCANGEEGAECKPEIPPEERCSGPAFCDGDTLVRCDDGRTQKLDCQALRGRCMKLPGASAPSCLELMPMLAAQVGTCGPCGCAAPQGTELSCDGRDEDGDSRLDESLDCGPVPVIAFIVAGAGGQTNHAREDVEAELAQANRLFAGAGEGAGLTFALEDVVTLDESRLLELDGDEFQRLIGDPRVHPARESFYVPVVFTDSIVAGGDTPKPGISTLPNSTCGGVQEGKGPEVGLLAVAKARYATTLAHELGHFLGLCHTHEQQERAPFAAYIEAQTGVLRSCEPGCRGQGDGICDTPFDPGPELCSYDASCRTDCRVDAVPDPSNLMGYYAACRGLFSDEQLALMQHTLALRRGWHRCLGAQCSCRLGDASCPLGMSCRSIVGPTVEPAARCALDGPRAPGADCEDSTDCGRGGVCLIEQATKKQRCVRPCLASSEDCQCVGAGDGLSVCLQDLKRG